MNVADEFMPFMIINEVIYKQYSHVRILLC